MDSLYNFTLLLDEAHIGDNFCSDERIMNAVRVLGYFVLLLKVFIPFLIIGFGSIDLFKAVQGGDEKAVSKSAKALGMRCLIGLVVFFVPTIIDVIFNAVQGYSDVKSDLSVCETCLLKPFSCENGKPDLKLECEKSGKVWDASTSTCKERGCSSYTTKDSCNSVSKCAWQSTPVIDQDGNLIREEWDCRNKPTQEAKCKLQGKTWDASTNTCN